VDGLGLEHEDEIIVETVIGLARSLGIAVVAEGVETDAQLHRLTELGCDFAQGFLFGRPRAALELPKMVTGINSIRIDPPTGSENVGIRSAETPPLDPTDTGRI
jgi:EAL domain-containing protein (putative c-di-GMP-specific phosphodiesterase class I)